MDFQRMIIFRSGMKNQAMFVPVFPSMKCFDDLLQAVLRLESHTNPIVDEEKYPINAGFLFQDKYPLLKILVPELIILLFP